MAPRDRFRKLRNTSALFVEGADPPGRTDDSDTGKVLLEQTFQFGGVLTIKVETLTDLARDGAIGCTVRLEEEVGRTVDLHPAEAALGCLRAADAVFRYAGKSGHDRHHRTLSEPSRA